MQSTSDEVKRELTARTDEVISKGSFGLPWYIGGSSLLISRHVMKTD